MVDWLRLVETTGDNFNIGIQYGEQTSDIISEYLKYTDLFYKKYRFSKHEVDRIRSRYEEGITLQSEFLIEVLKGMAFGANVSYRDLMNAVLHMEIRAAALPDYHFLDPIDESQEGCTAYAASGLATHDKSSLIGQNFDFSQEMQKFIVVSRVKPSKGNSFITVGVLGRPGSGGMNDKGLSIMMSGVRPKKGIEILKEKEPLGVPPTWTHHILRDFKKVNDAVKYFIRMPRGPKGENILICDSEKMAYLEVAYEKYCVKYYNLKDCVISSANHFVSENMIELGPSQIDYEGSYKRRKRALEFMEENKGMLDHKSFITLSTNHDNLRGSICRHGSTYDIGININYQDQGFTVASMIAKPSKRKFWICKGPPCENSYRLFKLN
jgi:isopenicillin-N N-acyltransferase-like protein